MQTRVLEQVLLFGLHLNPVTDRCEAIRLVAVSDDYDKLVAWYKAQLAEQRYKDTDGYYKVFVKGSPLEMFNPAPSLNLGERDPYYGHGIEQAWVPLTVVEEIRNNHYWVD